MEANQQGGVLISFEYTFNRPPFVLSAINDSVFPDEAIACNVSEVTTTGCRLRYKNYYNQALTLKVIWVAIG